MAHRSVVWFLLALGFLGLNSRISVAEPPATQPSETSEQAKTTSGTNGQSAEYLAALKKQEAYYETFRLLADTLDEVERNYVQEVDRRDLIEAAINGVMGKLDPYSNYIPPAELAGFRSSVEGEFGGIGIQITIDSGQLKVLSPIVGSPAYKLGILAGDKLFKIDNQTTKGMSLDQAVKQLKGQVGTSVKLHLQHAGRSETLELDVPRELIHVDTVLGDLRKRDDSWNFLYDPERRIGYVRISAFSRETARELREAIEQLGEEKLSGLILDLRYNPGGLLSSAIEISDLFLEEGLIVSTEGRNTKRREWNAHKENTFAKVPLVLLVNRYSASASEIVAACLQDHNRAVVIGERTWGKGSVQNIIELEGGKSALKLTTASYQRPSGKPIHRFPDAQDWGVSPNTGYEVKFSDDESGAFLRWRRDRDVVVPHVALEVLAEGTPPEPEEEIAPANSVGSFVDRQLQKALDHFSSEMAKK